MTTQKAALLTSLILTITLSYGQNYEPLDLAKKIFDKNGFENIENYVTGEYKGIPNGKNLSEETTTKFILLGQTEKIAVVAMTVLDSSSEGFDTYLHFVKDTVWKMSAFRGLAMTGMIEQMKMALEIMSPEEIDEMITEAKNEEDDGFSLFTSREEFEFELGNATLIIALDDNIIKHFVANEAEFERLKNLALTQLENEKVVDERSIQLIENLKADYRKLFISSVSAGDYELGNCINFLIGGMLDNTVGYIYVKNKKDLPEMNPSSIIMIREIGNGWYMYKTT